MAIDPAISAVVQAEQQTAVSADPAFKAERLNARSSQAASLLALAADAANEALAQRELLSAPIVDATLRVSGDQRSLLFKSLRVPSAARLIGGRLGWVRGIAYDPVDDRTDLQLIVNMS